MEDIVKKCSKCDKILPLSDFHNHKNGKFGKHHYCKKCNSIEKSLSYNPEKFRLRRISLKYGLTEDTLTEMYDIQEGKCKICDTYYDSVSIRGGLIIDHCHKTNEVRGLLCQRCNILLGQAQDNIEILKKAIVYIVNGK